MELKEPKDQGPTLPLHLLLTSKYYHVMRPSLGQLPSTSDSAYHFYM